MTPIKENGGWRNGTVVSWSEDLHTQTTGHTAGASGQAADTQQ